MSRKVRRNVSWGMVLLLVGVAVGLDIASRTEEGSPDSYSMVDALSAATRPGTSVVGLIGSDHDGLPDPASRDTELTEAQVEDMVRRAVAMAGGLAQRIEPDADWVAFKVNIVELKKRGSGVITDWRVVKALVRIVHEIVPEARITITEGPPEWIPPGSPEVQVDGDVAIVDGFEVAGFRQLLTDPDLQGIDLDILDLNFDEVHDVDVPGGGYARDTWTMPEVILESDFLISVPVLKIHDAIGMTNAMKNFIGSVPGMVYGWPKMSGYPPHSGNPGIPHHSGILDETILDIVSVAEPDFAVVDAIMCMERDKTDRYGGGIPVLMNTIIASADIIAADAVSAWTMGLNPFDIEYLTLGAFRGLGQVDPERIKVKGDPVARIQRRFVKSPADWGQMGEYGHYGQGCRTWLVKGPFPRASGDDGEYIDVTDPRALPGENGWTAPVYFHEDKIDLDKFYDDPSACAVYAYAEFEAPKEQMAELWVGSDEGMRVWINGEQVYEHDGRRRHRLPNDRRTIRIHEGNNTVLVRADQGRSRFDFSLNICEPEQDARYDGNRVWGLKFTVPDGTSDTAMEQTELAFDTPGEKLPEGAIVLEKARFMRHTDLVIGGLEGVVRHLDEDVPPYRVMGATGHAFRFCVADSVSPAGTSEIDVPGNLAMYENLGYAIQHIGADVDDGEFPERQQQAWEAITASLDRGTPAIARFGIFYWVVKGYHEKKEEIYISSWGGGVEPVSLEDLGTLAEVGAPGLDIFIFGAPRQVDPVAVAREVIELALREAHRPSTDTYHYGLDAYDHWMVELTAGRVDGFGQALTADLVFERRTMAAEYLREAAPRFPQQVSAELLRAGQYYDEEVVSLTTLASMTPMGMGDSVDLEDPENLSRMVALVRAARASEEQAVRALEEALEEMNR